MMIAALVIGGIAAFAILSIAGHAGTIANELKAVRKLLELRVDGELAEAFERGWKAGNEDRTREAGR